MQRLCAAFGRCPGIESSVRIPKLAPPLEWVARATSPFGAATCRLPRRFKRVNGSLTGQFLNVNGSVLDFDILSSLRPGLKTGELPISRTDLFPLLASDRHASNSGIETERIPLLPLKKRPVGDEGIARGLGRVRRASKQMNKTSCRPDELCSVTRMPSRLVRLK